MQLWLAAVLLASALAADDAVTATGPAAAAASHLNAAADADGMFSQAAVDAAIEQSVDAVKKAMMAKLEQERRERASETAQHLAAITKESSEKRTQLLKKIAATEDELANARSDFLRMQSEVEKLDGCL